MQNYVQWWLGVYGSTRRNAVIHGADFAHPKTIVNRAVESLTYLRSIQTDGRTTKNVQIQQGEEKWTNPPNGYVKTNWDIAIDTHQKRMGLGVIIRDDMGRVMAALSKTVESIQVPVIGEAMGALEAVEFSRDSGFFDIILEGDSKLFVEAITKGGTLWCNYGHIVGDIQEVMKAFKRAEIKHVKRTANKAAHGLAKAALKEIGERIWMEDIPNTIFDVVTLEQFALSS